MASLWRPSDEDLPLLNAAASALASHRFLRHRFRANGTDIIEDDDDDDYYSYDNNTYTTSVSIRVTPSSDYFVSWSILWSGFVIASVVASWQVWKESRMASIRGEGPVGLNSPTTASSVDDAKAASTNPSQLRSKMRNIIQQDQGEVVSTADETRFMFRKLLLLAMIARIILMPVQIWADPSWWQFVSDTLPEMIFASAWTLLVTFIIQLVGIATGTGTNTSPGIVIQATAYVVYLFLIGTQLFNAVATILLYALLCCIYAALFGIVLFFCPRLISLLQPTFARSNGLAIRLSILTGLCLGVFLFRTIGYARLVVMPPRGVSWWLNYGVLELFPTAMFLVIMHPSDNKVDRDSIDADPQNPNVGVLKPSSSSMRRIDSGMRRIDSNNSATLSASGDTIRNLKPPPQETTSLLKSSTTYGAVGSATRGADTAASSLKS